MGGVEPADWRRERALKSGEAIGREGRDGVWGTSPEAGRANGDRQKCAERLWHEARVTRAGRRARSRAVSAKR
eukprot:4837895-Pleurochrysis_carterae.AAC.1